MRPCSAFNTTFASGNEMLIDLTRVEVKHDFHKYRLTVLASENTRTCSQVWFADLLASTGEVLDRVAIKIFISSADKRATAEESCGREYELFARFRAKERETARASMASGTRVGRSEPRSPLVVSVRDTFSVMLRKTHDGFVQCSPTDSAA